MKVALLAQEIIKVPVLDFGFLIFRGLLRFYDHAMCHFFCFIVVDHNWQRKGLSGLSVIGMAHSLLVHLPKYFEILQCCINFSVTWNTGIYSAELDFNALCYEFNTPPPICRYDGCQFPKISHGDFLIFLMCITPSTSNIWM